MKTCKGCGKQVSNVSYSGFCDEGICTIREEGYQLGFREGIYCHNQSNMAALPGLQDNVGLSGNMFGILFNRGSQRQ